MNGKATLNKIEKLAQSTIMQVHTTQGKVKTMHQVTIAKLWHLAKHKTFQRIYKQNKTTNSHVTVEEREVSKNANSSKTVHRRKTLVDPYTFQS